MVKMVYFFTGDSEKDGVADKATGASEYGHASSQMLTAPELNRRRSGHPGIFDPEIGIEA